MKNLRIITLSAICSILTGTGLLQAGTNTVSFTNNWKNPVVVFLQAHDINEGQQNKELALDPNSSNSWSYSNSHGGLFGIFITDSVSHIRINNLETNGNLGGSNYIIASNGSVTRDGSPFMMTDTLINGTIVGGTDHTVSKSKEKTKESKELYDATAGRFNGNDGNPNGNPKK